MTEKQLGPSPEQQRAMAARGRNLLVSAAAGSGKTYTLVERIITSIMEGAYNIDELLVVTFTNAAAAEMRERIEKRITAQLRANPELERQLVLLPSAAISTIHVFCLSLIRQNFSLLDVDPAFRVAGEQEIELIRQRVIVDLFEACYEAQQADFLQFVAQYGSDRDDEKLHQMILRLYDFAQSQPAPEKWLKRQADMFDIDAGAAVEDLFWYKEEIHAAVERVLRQAEAGAQRLLRRVRLEGAEELATALEDDEAQVKGLIARLDGPWDELAAAVRGVSYKRQVAAKDVDKGFKTFVSEQRQSEVKDRINALRDAYFSEDSAQMVKDLRGLRELAETICQLAEKFAIMFKAVKRKKHILDFNDLEHLALQLLQHDDVAAGLQKRYREIMVDEYQDVNGVQETIIQRVTSGRNLFVVGDVKQSIYRFRLADPSLFQEKHRDYAAAGNERGEVVDMKENYRSRKEILAAVNYIFAQVMIEPEMELCYDEKAALYPKGDYPAGEQGAFEGEPVEICILESDAVEEAVEDAGEGASLEDGAALKGFAREAAFLAAKVRSLHESGRKVYDKDKKAYRPLCWRDIAVLLRSAKGKAQTLVEAFRAANVPAYVAVDAGYFAEIEIGLMLALLAVIDNAHQDIPLAAVLHSPMVGMTADELAEIRAAAPEGDFYDALAAAKNEKAAAFLENLAKWRTLSRRVGTPELLWQLYRDTGYYDYVGAAPGGLVRQANLRMLCDRAAEYERTNFRGLFRFLQFIRQMRERDTDLAAARTLGENEDVVRVMTVHKSKGLEFPVVILADMGKAFNMQDARNELLVHRDLGLGLYHNESDGVIAWRYPTLSRHAVASRIRRESKAEEMRALYVAMTRAREKLIMTGSVKSLAKRAEKWCRPLLTPTVVLSGGDVLEANCWLDWIAMAVARHKEGGIELRQAAGEDEAPTLPYDSILLGDPCWQVEMVGAPDAAEVAEAVDDDAWLAKLSRGEELPTAPDDGQGALLDWRYPHPLGIPAKITVTEWKRRQAALEDEAVLAAVLPFAAVEAMEFPPPDFLQTAAEDRSGASYGTLMHHVLQRLAFVDEGRDGIRRQIDAMASAGLLTPEEARQVNIAALAKFFASDLGQRAIRAKRRWREQAFSLLLPAREVDGKAGAEDEVYLQGVVDLFFEEEDGALVVVDYKTDRKTTREGLLQRYRVQMVLYARALQRITGKKVKEAYFYRLADGDAVPVDWEGG